MSKTPTSIEERRERIRKLKAQSPTPSPTSSQDSASSTATSNHSDAKSPTSGQPEHWRPQSDHMVVQPGMVPQFMIETAKLFQLCVNLEIEALSAEAEMVLKGSNDPRLPLTLDANRSILILAFNTAQQIQEKYAEMMQPDPPQLWLPDTSLSTPIPVRNSDGV